MLSLQMTAIATAAVPAIAEFPSRAVTELPLPIGSQPVGAIGRDQVFAQRP